MPGSSPLAVYPVTPDLAKATALASGHRRTAILYTCDYAACLQLARIVRNDLAAIGLRVEVRSFDHVTLYARLARPNEPFDVAFGTWVPDYPDPASMLNGMLADSNLYPTLDDPKWQRELAAAGQLAGPQRYLAFGRLALRLDRNAAPIAAYGNGVEEEFSPPGSAARRTPFTSAPTWPRCARNPEAQASDSSGCLLHGREHIDRFRDSTDVHRPAGSEPKPGQRSTTSRVATSSPAPVGRSLRPV
jgi:hypothetical protein